LVEKLKILSVELREGLKFLKQKPKSPEDIAKKLLDIFEGLLHIVDEKTKEFDKFKAEVSDRLEKLEESVGAMKKRP
jgi:hypothetical protein